MIEGFPTDIGLIYEGERIRKANMFAEFGGPKTIGAELLKVADVKKIKDGSVRVIGHDVPDLKEGHRLPFGVFVEVGGKKLEEDLEGVLERKMHYFENYVKGFMHLNSRDTIWCRIDKEAQKAGLTLKDVGRAMIELYRTEFPIIEKIQITFYTDEKEAKKFIEKAKKVYEARDERLRDMHEEDVDMFYSCVMCQSFAPEHVCTITPDKTGLCGSVSWLEGRAAVQIDPKGSIVECPKGELLDPENFEYSGVNEKSAERTNNAVTRVYLHSIFGYVHTACGCFESIAFYIPEVDGIGVVHRDFKGVTPFGIPFSTMAGQTGGGKQTDGFAGIAIDYLRSPKFFVADGGWNRIVWLPKELKERVGSFIPADVKEKVATEEDAKDLKELKSFLREKDHPVVKTWGNGKVEEVAEVTGEKPVVQASELQLPAGAISNIGGGINITLKNARIYAEKVIITRKEKK